MNYCLQSGNCSPNMAMFDEGGNRIDSRRQLTNSFGRLGIFAASLIVAAIGLCSAHAEEGTSSLLDDARAAWRAQEPEKALEAVGKAILAAPDDSQGYVLRGDMQAALEHPADAVADYTAALRLAPDKVDLYDRRGSEEFKRGHIEESIADFDRFIARRPEAEPQHWKRGISYYYARRFDEGRKQFEGYQTIDNNDVENAVWRYLCMAQSDGVEKARAALLPIKRDRRVPMMEVYALFRGDATPDDVLRAAAAGDPTPAQLNERLFYAHLYLGLYYEAAGDAKKAAEHITMAADKHKVPQHYMWDVARVHAERLRAKKVAE